MKKLYLILPILLILSISCADQIVSNCEEELPDPGFTATFSSIQEYVLTPNCASSGCHVGTNSPEGLDLSAGKSYANLVNVASQQSNLLLVDPGVSSDSWIIKKLTADGTSLMPPGSSLNTVVIDSIKKWIDEGARDD
jgi:hypothetical protein